MDVSAQKWTIGSRGYSECTLNDQFPIVAIPWFLIIPVVVWPKAWVRHRENQHSLRPQYKMQGRNKDVKIRDIHQDHICDDHIVRPGILRRMALQRFLNKLSACTKVCSREVNAFRTCIYPDNAGGVVSKQIREIADPTSGIQSC